MRGAKLIKEDWPIVLIVRILAYLLLKLKYWNTKPICEQVYVQIECLKKQFQSSRRVNANPQKVCDDENERQ